MLKSLFGDLTLRDPHPAASGFAATALLDTVTGEVNDRGQLVDRYLRDLFVTGSPAQAMRAHFAATRDDQMPGTRVLALHDPLRLIAPSVLKVLSEAGGQPIERLHLRDQSTLATLAMIGRITLPRRMDDTLKVYTAEVRAGTVPAHDIPLALMERCDLACVVVGAMPPGAVEELLAALAVAAFAPTWHCPSLLFLLPADGVAVAEKVRTTSWPRAVRVHALCGPLMCATTAWNSVLSHWNLVKPATASVPVLAPAVGLGGSLGPQQIDRLHAAMPPAPAPRRPGPGHRVPDPLEAGLMLRELMQVDGMLYATVVDSNTGQPVAAEGSGADFGQAASAATEVLRMHRRTLRMTGHPRPLDPVDEIVVAVGSRYHLLRTLTAFPEHFVFAVLDKLRSNLATARFRLLEAQQTLG
jgi:hypothetical protein